MIARTIAPTTKSLTSLARIDSALQPFGASDEAGVRRFLADHPDLLPLLDALVPEAVHPLGPGVSFALELYRDSEAIAYDELVAIIRTDLPTDEAVRQLANFDDGWWLDAMPTAS